MNLYKASNQWSTRPVDERFDSLQSMYSAVSDHRDSAIVAPAKSADLRVESVDGDLSLVGRKNIPARLTHFAFGQLAGYANAPAGYLRSLPPTLAAQNVNHGLAKVAPSDFNLLIHKNGDLVLRGLATPRYTRIWNADVVRRLIPLQDQGWQVPPARPAFPDQPGTRPATESDVLSMRTSGLSVQIGDPIAPAGLYASDHDMFAFMVNDARRISEPGNPDGLARGFFVGNGEVPGFSFWVMSFLYRLCCGNHIVWGAKDVKEIRIPHVGTADDRAFRSLRAELIKYADSSVSDLEAKIRRAKSVDLGPDKDKVLDLIFAKIGDVSRMTLDRAYQSTEQHPEDGSPRSPWGMAQGLTRISQTSSFADDRVKIDRVAGKVLSMDF